MTTMTIEFSGGLQAEVVATYGQEPYFIIQYAGLYAACIKGEAFDSEQEFYFVAEEDEWRDSLTDATCDVDIAMQQE